MKIRNVFNALMLFGSLSFAAACNNAGEVNNDAADDMEMDEMDHETTEMEERESDMKNLQAGMELEKFTKEAASDGMMEINAANMAMQRSKNQDVKDLAQMIKNDHQSANDQLKEVVDDQGWQLPQDMMQKHQEKFRKLQETSDQNFDQQYLSMMVEGHKKAIDEFQKMADKAGKQEMDELKDWIDNTLPALKKHHDRAKELQGQMK